MCSTKLPKLTLLLWEQSIQNKAVIPTWLELDSYLTERHRTLEAVDSFRSANFHHVQSKDTNRVAEFPKIKSFNTRLVPIPKGCDLCLYMSTYMSTLPTNDGRRSPSLYLKKAVVLQLLCKQPSIPGLHKRSQLSHLPRSASHIAASKQRPYYSADSVRPSKVCMRLSSTHHFVLFSASFRTKIPF